MAGTQFIGSELLKQVEGNYDRRIEELCSEINNLNALTVEERHRLWRVTAEELVIGLADRIQADEPVTDTELSGIKIESPPKPDDFKWTIQAKEGEIERLQRAKDKAVAYVKALAAGPDGVVTLAAADLRRIGYGL